MLIWKLSNCLAIFLFVRIVILPIRGLRTGLWPWLLLLASLGISCWGTYSSGLFRQELWTSTGVREWMLLTAAYFAVSYLIWLVARSWFFSVATILMLLFLLAEHGAISVSAVLLFGSSCYVVGALLLPCQGKPDLICKLLRAAMGVAVWSVTLGVAAHFLVNFPAVYLAAFALPFFVSLPTTKACLTDVLFPFRPIREARRSDYVMLAFAMLPVLCHLLETLKPETGSDALAIHLMVPAWISAHHVWNFDFRHIIWALIPMGADWCFAAVYTLGGEMSARLLNDAFLLGTASVVYAVARGRVRKPIPLLLAGLWLSTPLTESVTGSLMVENVWAFLLCSGLIAIARFWRTREAALLYAAAALFGGALGVKLGTIAFAPALFVLAVLNIIGERSARRQLAHTWVRALLIVLLCGLVPYVYAYVKTGNPVFPYMNHIFRSAWFDSSAPFADVRYQRPLTLATPYDMQFATHEYLESGDGVLGVHFLFSLALISATCRRRWPFVAWAALGFSFSFSIITLSAASYLRYIYPVFPLLLIVGAVALCTLEAESRRLFGACMVGLPVMIVMNTYFFPAAGPWHGGYLCNPLKVADREQLAREAVPTRALIAYLNERHAGDPAAFFGTGAISGLTGRSYVFNWHNQSYWEKVWIAGSPEEYGRYAESLGIRWFIAPRTWCQYHTNAAVPGFLLRYTDLVQQSGPFELRKLKPAAALRLRNAGFDTTGTCDHEMIDDQSPRVHLAGEWHAVSHFGRACGGTITYSESPGAEASTEFSGTSVTYVFTRAFTRGIAEVVIDGVSKGTVDLFSPGIEWRARIQFDGLNPGHHTLILRVLHSKNPDAATCHVDIDGFIIGAQKRSVSPVNVRH